MRLQLARALMCPSRPAAARRAHQPPGPRRAGVARSLAASATPARMIVISHDREFLDAVTDVTLHIENAAAHALRRQLQQVRGAARAADGAAAVGLLQAAGQDRAPAEVHRPLQGQGQQGQAGAKPRQGAGAHGEGRAAAGRGRLHLRVQGAGQHAEPDAGDQRRELRLRASRRRPPRVASVQRRQPVGAWPASASASWAPTARASRRW